MARSTDPKPKLRALLGEDGSRNHAEFVAGYNGKMRERCENWLLKAGAAGCLDKRQLLRWQAFEKMSPASPVQRLELFESLFPEHSSPCPCCSAHAFLAEEQRAGAKRWSDFGREVASNYCLPVVHSSDLKFESETSVTTAAEKVVFTDVPARAVTQYFGGADPRNWDESGEGEFFQSTEPGAWKDGRFRAFPHGSSEYADWCVDGKSGLMQEIILFPWSPTTESTVEAETVLTISELEKRGYKDGEGTAAEDEARAKADGRATTKRTVARLEKAAKVASLKYTYSLFVSARSRFAVGSVPGGLDVDQGRFRAVWTLTDENERDFQQSLGILEVEADKSVHYTQPADAAPGLGTLLNLIAPSLTGLLMRELVLEGTRTALERSLQSNGASGRGKVKG